MKTCMRCKGELRDDIQVGDKCPHCRVKFDFQVVEGGTPRKLSVMQVIGYSCCGLFVATIAFLCLGGLVRTLVIIPLVWTSIDVSKIRTQLVEGAPEQRLAAARELEKKSVDALRSIEQEYLRALAASDDATRVALMRQMLVLDRHFHALNTRHPYPYSYLPGAWIRYLQGASQDKNPEVRSTVSGILSDLGFDSGSTESRPSAAPNP